MKTGRTKRGISVLMTVVLVLGMLATALPSGLFSTTTEASVTYSPDKAGVCLLPAYAAGKNDFMNNHVFGSSDYNLNRNFKAYSWSGNITPGLSKYQSLDRAKRTKKNHDSLWYANWRYYPEGIMAELIKKGDIKIGYQGKLYNDKHSNIKNHSKKKWGKAMIRISGDKQGSIIYEETKDEADEQAQLVSDIKQLQNNSYLNYWAGNNRCVCNGSSVSDGIIYAVDTTAPVIKSSYISKKANGTKVDQDKEGFTGNEKGYLVLECSESIRFAQNTSSALKLKLNAYWKSNGQKAGTIEATLVQLQGKKLIFEFVTPKTLSSTNTGIYVKTFEMGDDAWAKSNAEAFTGVLLDENGNSKSFSNFTLKTSSKITDLAGNGLDWSSSKKTISNQVFLDSVNTTVEKVSLSVDKVTRADIPLDESSGEASRSDVFAAVGDKLTFTVTFDDRLAYTNEKSFLKSIKATLNVKNGNQNVTLAAKSVQNLKDTKANGYKGFKTKITFETLVITDAMYQSGGSAIKIMSLSGMDGVKDICGNALEGITAIKVVPDKQLFIDRSAPVTTLGLDAKNGIYTPISSSEGKILTFPINVNDVKESFDKDGEYVSGVTGIMASFKWLCGENQDKYAYEYCWGQSAKPDSNANWKQLYTTSNANNKNDEVCGKIPEFESGNGTLYLHLRLAEGVSYGAGTEQNKGKINGTLVVETMDYAGNTSVDSFQMSHLADYSAPSFERTGSKIDGNAERTQADITTTIKVKDDYGVQSVIYQWSEQQPVSCDLSSVSDLRSFEVPVMTTVTDSGMDSNNNKKVTLTVTVTDFAGNKTEEQYEYSLYFAKIENRYSFNGGTAANPAKTPQLLMKKPDPIQDAGGSTTTSLLSYVEVEFKNSQNHYLYICSQTTEVDVFAQSGWYYVSNKYTGAGTQSSPALVYELSSTYNGMPANESLLNEIEQCYGTGNITIRVGTTEHFNSSPETEGALKLYSLDTAVINEHTDIYLANKGNYSAITEQVFDNDGQDVKELLDYKAQSSVKTAYSIDGVSFTYKLSGEREEEFQYNLADMNVSASYVRLRKTTNGEKHTAVTADAVNTASSDYVCEKYQMTGAREQGITISSGISEQFGSGWYYLEFVVTTTDGRQYVTYYNDICLDRYVYTEFFSEDYNKTYSKTLEYMGETQQVSYKTADAVNLKWISKDEGEIGMGIAQAPEGYTVTQQLTFAGTPVSTENGVVRNLKMRVYNQADTENAQNALWQDMTQTETGYSYIYNVREAAVDEKGNYVFDETSYVSDGQYYLPLTEGKNVICYEVMSINGQIDKKTLIINATKQTIEAEFDKEQTETEAKWTLNEAVVLDHPRVAIELFDFYQEYIYASGNTIYCYEPGSWEFVIYEDNRWSYSKEEFNDNLVSAVITIEDVDGITPEIQDEVYEQDGMNFCYKFTVSDNNCLDFENLAQLGYDGEYAYAIKSANNTLTEAEIDGANDPESTAEPIADVTYNVPFEKTDKAQSAAIWTDYSTENYGIYKTQITSNEDGTAAQVCIWGTYMYRENVPEGDICTGFIGLDIMDARGNGDYISQWYSYVNTKPTLEVEGSYKADSANSGYGNMYAYDGTTCFDANENFVAECAVPLNKIQTYGADTNVAAISELSGNAAGGDDATDYEKVQYSPYQYHFLSSVPMICSPEKYELEFGDIFGNNYKQTLDAAKAFEEGSERIQIRYSETNFTNQNVTVMANLVAASGEAMDAGAKITTIAIVSYDKDGNRMVVKNGEVDLLDQTAARMVVEENSEIYVEGIYGGQKVSKTVRVSNIDKKLEEAVPVFLYGNGDTEPVFMEGSKDTVDGSVKVLLECKEDIYGINGDTEYVFPVGSKKGDSYTFEYRDEAGNTATLTVTLPYNVDKTILPEPDTTAPEFSGMISALRHSYTVLDGIFDVDNNGNVSESAAANQTMAQYVARGYKLAFEITDESRVKLIVRKAGAGAPTAYTDSSDSIEGLKVKGYTVEITKPAQFDLYFVDEAGNVKALKGFSIDSFDQEVADVTVQYKVLRNEEDVAFVRAYLMAAPEEEVAATNLDATTFMNEETVTEGGLETTSLVKRYYHDFFENESYTFTYIDVYGNTGTTTARVQGFDYGAPGKLGIQWYGTRRMTGTDSSSIVVNETPDTEGLAMVNHDITANITYNKAVSKVELYAYDETKENALGDAVTSADGVYAEATGKQVTVTYERNYEQPLIVRTQAKNSGKKDDAMLLSVQCIDKQAPAITVSSATVASDKQSVTYTVVTDEETYLNSGTEKATEHTFTATENGSQVITVMDAAGNQSSYALNVTEIDDVKLELMFGMQPDGSDLTTNLEELNIKAGDMLYVKASKEAAIWMGDSSLHLMAGETGSIALTSDAGMYLLHAMDTSTGKESYYKVLMTFKDESAPVITFDTNVLSFLEGTADGVIEEALKNGVTIEDNKDGMIDSSKAVINGKPSSWKTGIHTLTYSVSDAEGNTAYATRSVYIYEEGTPGIRINGIDAIPFGMTVVKGSTVRIAGTNIGDGALLVKYRAGIKTGAQMKYGTAGAMLKGTFKKEEQTFVLPKQSGFYTFYIRTQERKEQITYVYVDMSE